LAERSSADAPFAGLAERVLEALADAELGHAALPVAAARRPLVAEAARVFPLVTEQVAVARDVEAVRPPAEVVLRGERGVGEPGRRPDLEMVIHQVVPELAGAAAEPVRPHVRGRAHQDPRRV